MDTIILYTTHCPRCEILKEKLRGKHIKFMEFTDVDLMIEKGIQTAPVLGVNDKLLQFKEAVDWVNEQEDNA